MDPRKIIGMPDRWCVSRHGPRILSSLVHRVAASLLCLTAIAGVIFATNPIPQAADLLTIVHVDSEKDVRLDANLYIPDGGELLLNVEVPRKAILMDSTAPAKVTRVYSNHISGKFGVGEEIQIFVDFTSAVQVIGGPSIVLRTGCHESSCHTREIQRLRCQATAGKFAVEFAGQRVMNIPYNSDEKTFMAYLQRMTQIDHVLVEYSMDENSACTFFGNNITVTFESMNIDGNDGNLVEMIGDPLNTNGDGTQLAHIRFEPALTSLAWELQKGIRIPDRLATFSSQISPTTLRFLYTVRAGDNSSRLEYANSDSLVLSMLSGNAKILNANTTVPVNAKLPPPHFAGDWEKGIGSSLSANNALEIDVSPPIVTNVTSPHIDGTFGIGEVIAVHVYFSHPIVVTGLPTIVLETGTVDRIVPFNQVVMATENIAEFTYIVQAKDTSPDLTYASTVALELNGGSIKRKSTTPTTNAVLTLPVNGEKGSLSVNKNIVIDTSDPIVMSVTATSPDGVYTAGDVVQILVTFDIPVVVIGTPQLLLNTGKVDLFPGQFVQAAPVPRTTKTILFPPVDHGLSNATSPGLQFEIGGVVLTVASVDGDQVTMLETYTGTKVNATMVSGGPLLPIYTPGYRSAKYASGSGSTVLTFQYIVQIGDTTADLDYISTTALQLNGGSIKRLSTTPYTDANLTLAAPGSTGSLKLKANIAINTDAPQVTAITPLTRDDIYRVGDVIHFNVVFNLPVITFQTPSVLINIPGRERSAIYEKGSGTTSLQFSFLVDSNDEVDIFDVLDTKALRASFGSISGWIRRKAGTPMLPALLDLPAGGLSSKGIFIHQAYGYIISVSTPHEDGTIGAGEVIDFAITFTTSVNVDTTNGIPYLMTTTNRPAAYLSGTSTTILTFRYAVQPDDISTRLNYIDIFSLFNNGAVVTATSNGNPMSLVLPPPSSGGLATSHSIFVDTSSPLVQTVSTRAYEGIYTVGDSITFAVKFNFPVDIAPVAIEAGTPTLLLNAGVANGVSTSFIGSESDTVYFSYSIAIGQSVGSLAYFSRTALKCAGNSGMNKDPAQNGGFPSSMLFQTQLFTAWTEVSATTSAAHIRIKSFDIQRFAPIWSFEDGGGASSLINFDVSRDAVAPILVVVSSKLYVVWQESSTNTNNPGQIRVAVYLGNSSGGSARRWMFIDKNPASSTGINKDSTQNAFAPHATSHNSKLYVAWHENAGTSFVPQVRVVVYNGQDGTPAWLFIDGNQGAQGLNFASAKAARNIRLTSCGALASSSSVLYAVWEEQASTLNIPQIRVAAQMGTDAAPKWTFVDGNGAFGLNFETTMSANAPSITCLNSKVVVAWQEVTASGVTRIRAKMFNGYLTNPAWTVLDNGKGLNIDLSQNAANIRLRVGSTGLLYASWQEVEKVSLNSQIRVAMLTFSSSVPTWQFLDGGGAISNINDDISHDATRPVLVLSGQSPEVVYAMWQEVHANSKIHVRGSVLKSSELSWQSLHYGCIRRASTNAFTPANLLLPELDTPGALDFGKAIQIDTSVPVVRTITLSGDIPRVTSTASVLQTIDIFNKRSISQGEYRLRYGDSFETKCISWNATGSGSGSVEEALESISGLGLDVSVSKDSTAFLDGDRYFITFAFPSTGLQRLQVKTTNDATCDAFVCSSNARLPCGLSLIRVNSNIDVGLRTGVVDVAVQFSYPVVVSANTAVAPTLRLNTDAVGQDAVYTARSAFLEIDVGTESPSPIVKGAFRLAYGDFSTGIGVGTIYTTNCIDIAMNDDDAIQELRSNLEAIVPLNTIGIRAISRRTLRNGYRYGVTFRSSGDLLDLVAGNSATCRSFAGRTQTIDITATSAIQQGEITVQLGDAVSACIPWNIRAKGSSSSMESIISALVPDRVIPVQVIKDPTTFTYGHRYYVNLMILDDVKQPLLAFNDASCSPFLCDGSVACVGLTIAVNADFKVTRAYSETLSFRYTVQNTDDVSLLTYKDASALRGDILRASNNPTIAASLALTYPPNPILVPNTDYPLTIVSLNAIPTVVSVYAISLDGVYTAGDVIIIFVELSDPVFVQGSAILELNSGGTAVYFSGSGTKELEFRYKVLSGETSADLDYLSIYSLRVSTTSALPSRISGGSDPLYQMDANLLLPPLGSALSLASYSSLVIDTTQPTIVSVTSARLDTPAGESGYGAGDIIDIVIQFSTDVVVFGVPSLTLNSGSTAKFTYAGYRQVIDVGVHARFPVVSGEFAIIYGDQLSGCIDYTDAQSTSAKSLKSRLLEIEAIKRIGLLSVSLVRVKNGHRFVIEFDSTQVLDVPVAIEPIQSDVCAPLLPADDSAAHMITRSTDTFVTFHYTVGTGEHSTDLDYVGTSLTMVGSDTSIKRRSRVPSIVADVTLAGARLASTKDLVVDGTSVSIVDIVADTAGGTYGVAYPATPSPLTVDPGQILFHLIFSRPVTVIGSPTVELATGSLQANGVYLSNRVATFAGQPQPNQVAFLYSVQEGDYSASLSFARLDALADAQIYVVSSTMSVLANRILPRLMISATSTIAIDAHSAPTTVKVSALHSNGTFGAGEAIKIQVIFSKEVILQTGLNRNQDFHARNPFALEFQNNIYIFWTEWESLYARSKSYLYLSVFASDTLELVSMATTSAMNRIPDTFIEKVTAVVWNNAIYAAWDEGGLIYCAVYNGLVATVPWTLIPNMGANKDMAMPASDPLLIVHNLELMLIWREEVSSPANTGQRIGQIRVAQRNDDYDAPLWIFHDGNQLQAGLNKDPAMNARDPSAIVYLGRLYLAWSEYNKNMNAYQIIVTIRYIKNRDESTWVYLEGAASTKPSYTFISSYRPRFGVRKKGFEDTALLLSWYRDTATSNASEVVTSQVLDSTWEASTTANIPEVVIGITNLTVETIRPNAKDPQFGACGSNLYSLWREIPQDSNRVTMGKVASLKSSLDLFTGWTNALPFEVFNHNTVMDVVDSYLVCSSSSNPHVGILWTEFDEYSTKLRFRHQLLYQYTIDDVMNTLIRNSYGEVTSGTPLLSLATTTVPPGTAVCIDKSGLQSSILTFLYLVQQNDVAADLDVLDSNAFLPNGAKICDVLQQIPSFTFFPGANDFRSLSYNNDLKIDTTSPTVADVSALTASGEYGVGEEILIQVTFTAPVIVLIDTDNNLPKLYLRSDELHYYDAQRSSAIYLDGSGTNILTFKYITTVLDYCNRLDYFSSDSLILDGETALRRLATFPTTDASLMLPPPRSQHSLSSNRAIAIKATQPQILAVNSTAPNGTYYPGDSILVQVLFSLPVTVFGAPILLLDTGKVNFTEAELVSGNESATLMFEYSIEEGDTSARLDLADDRQGDMTLTYVMSLILSQGSQIKRTSADPYTDAVISLPAPGLPGSLSANKNIVIDSARPTVVDVRTTTPNGTYDIGQEIEILVEFSRKVVVIGTPELVLNIPAPSTRTANYHSGSTTALLRFTYTIAYGDNTLNTPFDIAGTNAFILRSLLIEKGIIQASAQVFCLSANPTLAADLTLPRPGVPLRVNAVRSLVGNNHKIYIRTDGFRVQDVQADILSGIYSPGQRIILIVTFTDKVVVQGSPRIKLNAHTLVATYATYIGGSGTTQLQFTYTIISGDSCLCLDAASQYGLELNQGAITDMNGVNVPLQLGALSQPGSLSFNKQIEISSQPPTVERVYSLINNDGDYGVGDELQLAVQFSRKVTIAPASAPTLLLQFASGTRQATYTSGDGTQTLRFTLTTQSGDATAALEYADQHALVGTIFASATTPTLAADLLLPVSGTVGSLSNSSLIRVVSMPPQIISVRAADRNGTYGYYDTLRIRVQFSFRVVVMSSSSSSCVLALSVGNSEVCNAVYIGGSTTKILEFEYKIEMGDRSRRLGYVDSNSLKCSILQFSKAPSLAAVTTLPSPGTDGSLGFSSAIRIDSSAPRILSVSSLLTNGIYGAGQVINLITTFSEAVMITNGTPRLRLAIASNCIEHNTGTQYATYTTGSGTNVLTFQYIIKEGDMAFPLEYDGVDALSMDTKEGKITAATSAYRLVSLRLPISRTTGSLSNNCDIRIDTLEPPRVIAVGSPTTDGIYTVGDTLQFSITFSAPVAVTGTPTLLLDIVNFIETNTTTKQAKYISGSGTASLLFEYEIQVGDHSDRLDYRPCPFTERRPPKKREWDNNVICTPDANALQLGVGGSIKRMSTFPVTDAILDLPEVSAWPKVRFATSSQGFVYVNQVTATTGIPPSDQTIFSLPTNEVSISQQQASVYIYSNGIPHHASTLLDTNQIEEQRYFIELNRFPVQVSNPLVLGTSPFDGFIGVFLNGIPFKNASNAASLLAVDDACGGALDEQGRYFYRSLPICYLDGIHEEIDVNELTHHASRIVGYAFDGFPVFGFYDERGELPSLDECNGRVRDDGQYGYHLVPPSSSSTSPSARSVFMPCLRSMSAASSVKLNVFRSPVDIGVVEGLSLAALSHFDGLVVDENPATPLTASLWLNPTGVSVIYTSSSVVVRSTGVPDGQYGPFPNTHNRFVVKEQNYVFQLPRQPIVSSRTTPLPQDSPIGVMINGVPFYTYQTAAYGNVMDSNSPALLLFDKCNGLVDEGGDYRYYASPDCLLHELGGDQPNQPSPLIGYALDGFPLYGPYTESGTLAQGLLDDCNGRIGDDGLYRYHVTAQAPYLLGCFRGQLSASSTLDIYRSLSYSHALRINTDQPRIVQVFANNYPGTYVVGETLDIMIEWSTPVQVDTSLGIPTLSILNSSNVATYNATWSTSRRSAFRFCVTSDNGEFNYDTRAVIQLNRATIKRIAQVPTLEADLRLMHAEKISRFASKHQLIKDLRVVIRGLYHPQASDLRVRLFHGGQEALLFTGCCDLRDAFGLPDATVRVNMEQIGIYPRNPTSGVGFDYGFQDSTIEKNLARDGRATALQSSTSAQCVASNAIDGHVHGFISSQSVAQTEAKPNQRAWWELRLLDSTIIGTIRLWLPEEEVSPAVVQVLSVNANDGVSQVAGTFTLVFTRPNGEQQITGEISVNAVAMVIDEATATSNPGTGKDESLQAKLAALSEMPRLFITRSPADAALSPNGAFTWFITFLDNPRIYNSSIPLLSIGENSVLQGNGIVRLSSPLPADDRDELEYRETDRRIDNLTPERNVSMFPFWIMLFDAQAMMDFETLAQAQENAVWSHRVEHSTIVSRWMISVNPPSGLKAQYIRVIAESFNVAVTLAEVEVFQERSHLLSQYASGSPVTTVFHPGAETWSPEEPFQNIFGGLTSEGVWTLAIQDTTLERIDRVGGGAFSYHGAGALSDWVLYVTNLAGKTQVYYMDISAHIKTLPRHGKLFIGIEETEADHVDVDRNGVLDSVEASSYLQQYTVDYDLLPEGRRLRTLWNFLKEYEEFDGIEVLTDPSERQKLLPIACDRTCLAGYGVDPYFDPATTKGDVATKLMRVTGDRVIKYIPNDGFQGVDTLTFAISIGNQESLVLGTVEIKVKECQDPPDCWMDMDFIDRNDY